MITVDLTLSPEEAASDKRVESAASAAARIPRDRIAFMRIVRRSVDARRGKVRMNLCVELYVDDESTPEPLHIEWGDVSHARQVVIVGAGPAGLFAALRLIERGLRPVIVERGKEVSARKHDIAALNRNLRLDEDSNYCFGEGGAGTFSDGKLFTRSKKRGAWRKMLEILHMHGASDDILFESHPHIGTDRLPRIIAAIRETIKSAGGVVLTGKRVSSLIVERGSARGVVTSDGDRIEGKAVILATGHSARDIYRMLYRQGIELQAKPFAMGVRVEHPQELIDRMQYRMPSRGEWLPAASYSLVAQAGGRGVYSFCMCPGGFIVPAATSAGESVVNGMSPSGRNSQYANSGIVTEIRLEDTAPYMEKYGVLAGLHYQAELERLAHAAASGGVTAPAQRLTDFVAGRTSQSLPRCSFNPGLTATDMKSWMPDTIYRPLAEGFRAFDRKMRGFVTEEAVVVGVESRTSSPVRIPRDPATLEHPAAAGLFPAGEGAGYAGGILSAAMDGERVADAVANRLKR